MNEEQKSQFSRLIQQLFSICGELESMFPGRHFTPDGHTMGSIGEVLAAARYGLDLERPSRKGRDARKDDVAVEVKATSGKRAGSTPVAFSTDPDGVHVLVVLVTSEGEVFQEYNGPGDLLLADLGPRQKNGQRTISLAKLRKLQKQVPEVDQLQTV